MRVENLLYPGVIANGLRLRTESAKAISYAELYMQQSSKDQLAAFFGDCAYKTGGTYTPQLPSNQAIVSSGAFLPMRNSTASITKVGTATVTAGAVTAVSLAATDTFISNGDGFVPVKNSSGSITTNATAVVAGGVLTAVNLAATRTPIANADVVAVKNSAGTTVDSASTIGVASGVNTGVTLSATKAVLTNADANVVVQNSAGAAITSAGVAAVASGVLSNVKLPATIAAVANGTKYNAVSVTGSGNFATFTVANGVITAIVLSAS